jgi:uncharacterized protein YkwD
MTRRDWIWLAIIFPIALRAEGRASKITVANFDPAKLGAAIFAESNRVRRAEKRARFLPQAELETAAADQAGTMAARLRSSHEGPFTGQRNAFERVRLAGLEPEVVAENVSAISLPTADSGETWSDDYERLAEAIVKQWLNSPGHRRNLLRRDLTHLGCAARLAQVPASPPVVFSVQVFCRPKDERWKPFAER